MGKIFKIVIWFLSICSFAGVLPVRADESVEYKEEVNSAFNIIGERISKVEKKVSADKVKVSATIFSQYSYNLMEKGADYNAFELTRAYINFATDLTETISAKLTTDIHRYSTSDPKNLQLYLKYGYVEFKDTPVGKITVGLQSLPWVSSVEKVWKHRFVAKVFADIEGKQTSADLGVGVSGNLLNKSMEYNLTLANGEGYNSVEANKAKDGYARLGYEITKGLKINTHYRYGLTNIDQKRDRANALLSLEQDDYTIATEYLYTVDQSAQGKGYYVGSGYSVFGFYKLGAGFSLFGRYDWFDPDVNPDKTKNAHFTVIYGIGYDITKDVKVVFDNQQVKYEDKAGKSNENAVYAHMLINF